jgi:hypothetical protein
VVFAGVFAKLWLVDVVFLWTVCGETAGKAGYRTACFLMPGILQNFEIYFCRGSSWSAWLELYRQGSSFGAALAGQFEEADYAGAVFGRDREWCCSVDGVAHVGVVAAVVPMFGFDLGADYCGGVGWIWRYGQDSPLLFSFGQPVAFAEAGDFGSGYESGLLGVEAVLAETAFGAVEDEARGVDAGEHGSAAMGSEARVFEGDVEGVFDGGVVAVFADACCDAFGDAEENEGLIDEVRAEVEEHAVGIAAGFLPGGFAGQGTEAVEVGLVGYETAYGMFVEEFADGEEVAVPAAVVEGREDEIAGCGKVAQFPGFGAGSGEGLVDDDVLAGEEGLFREGVVGLVGSAYDDKLDGWVGECFFDGTQDAGVRVGLRGFVAFALDDSFEPEAGDCAYKGRVKDLPCESKADYCYADVGHASPFRLDHFATAAGD